MSGKTLTAIIQAIGKIGLFATGAMWGVYFDQRLGDPALDIVIGAWVIWLMVGTFGIASSLVIGDKPNA